MFMELTRPGTSFHNTTCCTKLNLLNGMTIHCQCYNSDLYPKWHKLHMAIFLSKSEAFLLAQVNMNKYDHPN